mgnify:CR=1 FL=1|jgi:hypothetical protein|tara:strand:- start:1033 stop:2241 length:1209 start_codon:yes stop_codon:yes gene_type:complete
MTERRLDDWLSAHLRYTEESESPLSYHTWAGVAAISAALQRKVYMPWGHSTVYANNYIVLVGPSGIARKAEPIEIVRWMVDELNISTIGEDNSQESIIRDIKMSEITYVDPITGNHQFQSAVTCFCEELSVFTGYQNSTFLAYLTNWYDSRDRWTRRTKHQGVDEITGMCFNMLAATAPDWLPHILTKEAIGGGFTSRCIFVVEDAKRKTVTNPNLNMPDPSLRDDLIHDLEIIQSLVGEYKFSPEALEKYERWYEDMDKEMLSGRPILGDPALNGYASRRPTHAKKIAMVMAASHTDDLTIGIEDLNRALAIMKNAEIKMNRIFGGIGRARYAEDTDNIIQYIKKRGSVRRSQLLKDFYRNVDDVSLESIITVLRDMKVIEVTVLTKEGDRDYRYIGTQND